MASKTARWYFRVGRCSIEHRMLDLVERWKNLFIMNFPTLLSSLSWLIIKIAEIEFAIIYYTSSPSSIMLISLRAHPVQEFFCFCSEIVVFIVILSVCMNKSTKRQLKCRLLALKWEIVNEVFGKGLVRYSIVNNFLNISKAGEDLCNLRRSIRFWDDGKEGRYRFVLIQLS